MGSENGGLNVAEQATILDLLDSSDPNQANTLTTDYSNALSAYLARIGAENDGVSDLEAFRALDQRLQINFLTEIFFNELKLGSQLAAVFAARGISGYARGRVAIESLFPGEYAGDMSSLLSAVQTLDGGDINVLAPGGLVDAGTTASASAVKNPVDLGYVAFRAGDVNIYAFDSINVNSTRIFAQGGGDVNLWADRGNLDAGRGSRDAQTLATVNLPFNEFGDFVNENPISVAGSGIRTLAPEGGTAGNAFLAAPEGIIDAGDAGIASGSGLVLAAQEVANADFISSGGPSIGIPAASVSVGANIGNLGDVSAAATESVAETTQRSAAAAAEQTAAAANQTVKLRTSISVEVLRFGL